VSRTRSWLPPLTKRLATGRPVITREQASELSQHVLKLVTNERADFHMSHTVRSTTQLASGRVRTTDVGETLQIAIRIEYPDTLSYAALSTNQLDDAAIQTLVERANAVAHDIRPVRNPTIVRTWDEQDTYLPTSLWHESSVDALSTSADTAVPKIVDTVRRQGFVPSGFVGVITRVESVLTERGITAFSEETDCEVTVTARPDDAHTTGWSGAADRDWSRIDASRIAAEAAETCRRNLHPQALEPGRRTAILSPEAVAQLLRFLTVHFSGSDSDQGYTAFSKVPNQMKGSRWNERLFDTRVKITTDPADPDGGFRPWFGRGYADHPTTWVEDGRLKYLMYGTGALRRGKKYADLPFGFRLDGGETTVDQMIAQCEQGIYVNRFSNVEMVDKNSGLLTGVTRDGCFLVKNGKIDRPVKNFRFYESPFFFLNKLVALGPTRRVAYGYTPWSQGERMAVWWPPDFFEWPRRPIIVPPLMVQDFNFSALVDAV
jgi:predicted Zn-dependent protease